MFIFHFSLSRGHYQPTYQPPEGVYLLNIAFIVMSFYCDVFRNSAYGCKFLDNTASIYLSIYLFPNFQNCERCEEDLKDNKHNLTSICGKNMLGYLSLDIINYVPRSSQFFSSYALAKMFASPNR